MEDWLAARTRKGVKCSNCGVIFAVDRGDGKKLVVFPNGAGGTAMYVVCAECGACAQDLGLDGIPEVARDSELTVLVSPYNPANDEAFKSVQ
jgi:hypothetical protein